jgi:hypothetical protein
MEVSMTRPTDRDAQGAALARRTLLVGAGVASTAVLAAQKIPLVPNEVADAAAQVAGDRAGAYRLSPHVLRYYETAKV